MEYGYLLLLLGAGAMAVLSDMLTSNNSDNNAATEPATPNEEEDPSADRVIIGTEENDRLESLGGETLFGLGGDDVLISYGNSTMFGGDGDDVLVSVGGGAVLIGGEGADTFRIELLGVRDDGTLLDFFGQPVAPAVIDDFNPDTDRLILDLLDSTLLPDGPGPVVLTGTQAPDGEGLMVQVNGVNAVQLSSYGGGDMQTALEALVKDFDALQVIGVGFEFPPQVTGTPEDVEIIENPDGSLSFLITDDYSGGGELVGVAARADILDLSQVSGSASIIEDDEGNIYLRIEGDDVEPTLLKNVTSVILGSGENVVSVGSVPGGFTVTATDGTNDISAWRGGLDVNLQGGTNTVYLADEGTVNLRIGGGDNTITADEFVGMRVTMLEGADGTTVIEGGETNGLVEFLGSEPDLSAVLTEMGGMNATWADGGLEVEWVRSLFVQDGATVDASARDPAISPFLTVKAIGPSTTVIGSAGVDLIEGQGRFFGGPGDDGLEIMLSGDGGAEVDGGPGDDFISVYLLPMTSGDIVLTGGEGQDQFYIAVGFQGWTGESGVVRITDFEEDERIVIDVANWFATPDMPQIPITFVEDAQANEVQIQLEGRPLIILENRSTVPPGAVQVFDARDL